MDKVNRQDYQRKSGKAAVISKLAFEEGKEFDRRT